MKTSARIATLALCIVAGCSGMSRMNSYGSRMADFRISVDGKRFAVWIHPKDHTLIVQRSAGGAFAQGLGEGLTLNTVNASLAKPYFRHAAEAVLKPEECKVVDLYELDHEVTWEAEYECPAGREIYSLIGARKTIKVPMVR